jgi:hypothetical protein
MGELVIDLESYHVETERIPWVCLLADLLESWLTSRPCVPTRTRSLRGISSIDGESYEKTQSVTITIMPWEHWVDFSDWCQTMDITVHVRRKEIDGSKTWWPNSIYMSVKSDHPELMMSILRHAPD